MQAETPDRIGRRQMRGAIVAVTLFLLLQVLSAFRWELLGLANGYAPHNFFFNVTFFWPMLITIITICAFVVGGVLGNWKKISRTRYKLVPLVLTSMILALYFIRIIGR